MPPPRPRHGEICVQIAFLLRQFLERHRVGRVASNDSGVKTENNPDTVRGADVAFFAYDRWPTDADEDSLAPGPPNIVFEVRSSTDRTPQILHKVYEYLDAGVEVVVVVDPKSRAATIYKPDGSKRVLQGKQKLTFSNVLKGFSVPVSRFFEF